MDRIKVSIITSLFCLLIICWSSLTVAQSYFNQLEPHYNSLLLKNFIEPEQVLQQLLNNPPASSANHTLKAQHQMLLSYTYITLTLPDKAFNEAQKGLKLVSEQSEPWLYHHLNLNLASASADMGKIDEVSGLAQQAFDWANKNQDTELEIYALMKLGMIANLQNDSLKALTHFLKAYNLAPTDNDKQSINSSRGLVASQLALVYEFREEPHLSKPYFEEAVSFSRKNDYNFILSISLYGLGRANMALGNRELGTENLAESTEIARSINDIQGVAYGLKDLAKIEFEDGNFQKAESMLLEAASIFKQSGSESLIRETNLKLGEFYLAKKNLVIAEKYYKLITNSFKDTMVTTQKHDMQTFAANFLAAKSKYKDAFNLIKKSKTTLKEILNGKNSINLYQIQSMYDLHAQEKENLQLKQGMVAQENLLLIQKKKNQNLVFSIALAATVITLLTLFIIKSNQNSEKLHQLATFDSLTGLRNRGSTIEQIEMIYAQPEKLQNAYLMMADLDHFKQINDTYGHHAGDDALTAFGHLCTEYFKPETIKGRVGGEEFLLLFHAKDATEAHQNIDEFRKKVKDISVIDHPEISITISIGITKCINNSSFDSDIKIVDQGLYQAKKQGRNQTIYYTNPV